MKGTIIIPKIFDYSYVAHKRYIPLFKLCEKEMGFKILVTTHIDINSPDILDNDVILAFKLPEKCYSNLMPNLSQLDKRVKLITYHTDIHSEETTRYTGHTFRLFMNKMLTRADKILCSYDYAFKKLWPKYVNKYEFFPQFFSPYSDFKKLEINQHPINKCLLSGAMGNFYYPLRTHILNHIHKAPISYLPHPGYTRKEHPGAKIGYEFVKEIHNHACAIATSSNLNYVVVKYFEIPATGCLLLANQTPDLIKLGFKNGIHYIEIDRKNCLDKIKYVVEHPKEFEKIRQAGRELVLEHHSEINRFNKLKEIIEEVIKNNVTKSI